ncbi:hypothetical protein DQ04_11181010 [Trypanosoma grayi]|uniref:hypothetical protein n=1 Tax=Trypanosoma grayi TaxID=71804 RepID=UPI0004F429EB|nr:hypothetical protein DQ04_11181010 [Trypanosoma grayi]KEG07031.1 hypothetical protein DQ04_11181010 [Trypanosoma grayi]
MTEESMSSNKRIQLLRERLELYNATIAEAMGAVAGVSNVEKSAAPAGAAKPSEAPAAGSGGGKRRPGETAGGGGKEFAPRLERDLAADFSAARKTSDETRRCDKRTVPPPPSPPQEAKRTAVTSSSVASSAEDDDDSTTLYSDSEEGGFLNPFLNEPVSVEDIALSVREMQRAEGLSAAKTAVSAAPQSRSKNNSSPLESSGKRSADGNSVSSRTPPPPLPEEAESEAGALQQKQQQPQQAGETVTAPSFAQLETAYHRLTMAEQAVVKLQRAVDIERFPRALPQREQAQRLAGSRDALTKKEQALRRREPTGRTLTAIYETDALNVDQQVQQLLADCDAAQSLFARVHDRRAAVAEKERLLKRRLSELDDRQREVRERRQALAALERRTEQREASLVLREENYRNDIAAHKEREQSLQARISEVEALNRKVTSWMKILEDRDTEIAAKEQRLRRVQADLVRRSEELLCYRNARAKQPTRMAPSRAKSP